MQADRGEQRRRGGRASGSRGTSLALGLIGNCAYSALIDRWARVCWACLPRMDSDPVFCSLLNDDRDDIGLFDVELINARRSEQAYLRNTAVLSTRILASSGDAIEVTDFAPRFMHFGRMFRPMMLVRQVRPLAGEPRVRIRLRPAYDYGSGRPRITHGSNHIRYVMPELTLRLTTDVPVSYVLEEVPFVIENELTLILGPDESLTQPVAEIGREFREETRSHWLEWTRSLAVPFEWQDAVIRAAITLKLSNFEETGAVIAAPTTSIPEAPGTERNWDYRYCWLRDAYFVVHALNRLGATRTMEGYLGYLTNVVANSNGQGLQPVYGITLQQRLPEREQTALAGYRGMGPVRVGNQAHEHVQNDVYGSVVLAATQAFFDQRLFQPGTRKLFERLEAIGERAVIAAFQPDASLWEYRSRSRIHTFSSVMCWAACDRLARIAAHRGWRGRAAYWRRRAERIRETICAEAWNPSRRSFTDAFGSSAVDASLLLLGALGFLRPDDPRFIGTVDAIERELRRGPYLFRYAVPDDFGTPETAFVVCTFWYIEALALLGRVGEARDLFEHMLDRRNPVGLLSEDLDPTTGELWGNFPQTYSMVGLINAAIRLSRSWEEAF